MKHRSHPWLLPVFLALATLPACGGGGASAPAGGVVLDGPPASGGADAGTGATSPPPATTVKTVVVVDPTSPEDLDRLCDEKQATVLGEVDGTDYCRVEIPKGTKLEDFLKDLEDEPCVEDAQPDDDLQFPEGGGTTVPAFVEDDPSSVKAQVALDRIGAAVAQARGHFGFGVVVAVLDTGVDSDHPLLAGRVLPLGHDFVDDDDDPSDVGNGRDDDRDGRVDEGVGHGTFVASLVLAVAPAARILPLRALDSDANGTASGLARAIVWAAGNGAHVINFSGGLPRDMRLLRQALEYARSRNVAVICAAGNRAGPVDFPASLPDSFAVTSVGLDDRRSSFASYGNEVDLAAPGEDLLGAHPLSPSGLARWSGTSFSTALVTGAFALLAGAAGEVPVDDLYRRLRESSASLDAVDPEFKDQLGAGRLDLDAATDPADDD